MESRIENACGGFTADVLVLLNAGNRGEQLRPILSDVKGDLAAFIRSGLIDSLAPIMVKLPPFVQQVVARALIEHVDWETVAEVISTNPEEN